MVGTTGSALVTGIGSSWTISNQLNLGGAFGDLGTGLITVQNQGLLSVGQTLFASPSSAITVNGGTFKTQILDSTGPMGAISLTDPASGPALNINGIGGNYSGSISGSGSVLKSGNGFQTLAGANTYTGTTTVTGGALDLASGALCRPHLAAEEDAFAVEIAVAFGDIGGDAADLIQVETAHGLEVDLEQIAVALDSAVDGGLEINVGRRADDQDEDRRKSKDAGFDHHMVKPVDFAALMKLLVQKQPTPT